MTYRERREAKAERLREWADKRTTAARQTLQTDRDRYAGDVAFNTQPGHIPERARVIARGDRAYESLEKAHGMDARADGIERQLATSIYDDDPNAIEQLETKIAALVARQQQMKAANAVFRKTHRAELAAEPSAYHRDLMLPYQSYTGQNLSGNISRLRKRLIWVRERTARTVAAEAAPAGVVIERIGEYVRVTFAEKPDREILDALRGAGFWWKGGSWGGRIEALPASVAALEVRA